jgi:drug/metabolite transporter (DMT)-like permease
VLSSRFLPPLAVAGTVISWAAAFPAIRFALREVDPLPLAAIRFALAAVFAIAWLAWSRPERPSIRDFYLIVVCGALGIAAYNMLLNAGQTTVSAGAASFIVNTQPLFMVLLALVFLGERFTGWSWVGAALGFGGVAMIASGQPGGFNFGTGTNFIVTSFVLLAGAVIMLPWLPGGARQLGGSSATTIGCIIFLAVAPAAIGQTCWTFAIKSFGAARAGQFLYLIPPMAVLFSWAVIAEVPSWSTIYGGLFALLGVVIVNTWGRA